MQRYGEARKNRFFVCELPRGAVAVEVAEEEKMIRGYWDLFICMRMCDHIN